MQYQAVIDAVVRQTMVFIARLSTAGGVRSPLASIADDVFVSLVRELEEQGLGKKVLADMFGMALRSYRQKVQRLSESVTYRGTTLWGAIHEHIAKHEGVRRAELLRTFARDDEATVRSILNDLVESGLVRRSGAAGDTWYRMATAEELEDVGLHSSSNSRGSVEALVWVQVYGAGLLRRDRLEETLHLPSGELDEVLRHLVDCGRIREEVRKDGVYYATNHCLIPVGEAAGWEAAVIDHHRAVLTALGAKTTAGCHVSATDDTIGGTTLSYDVWPGHPHEQEARELLSTTRKRAVALWEKIEAYNRSHSAEDGYQITFYAGQYLRDEE